MLNNNYNELVKKYEKYQNKQITSLLLKIILVVVIVCIGIYYFLKQSTQNSTKEQVPKKMVDKPIEQKKPVAKPKENIKTKPQEIQKQVKPKNIEKKHQPPKQKSNNQQLSKQTTTKHKTIEQNPIKLQVTKREELVNLLKEYDIKQNFTSSINLAKYYFENDRYQQSIKWAIKSSKFDPSASEPWILYAKTKQKQGRIKVAIRALDIYLRRYKSKEAQNLLNTLKNTSN